MSGNKIVTILITAVIVLVFVFYPFAVDQDKARRAEEEAAAAAKEQSTVQEVDQTRAVQEVYAAGPKMPEVYDPSAPERKLEISGAAYSDDNWAVLNGNCAVGALVTAKAGSKEYSVQSAGGTFALRFEAPTPQVKLQVSQSYEGKQIGEPLAWQGTVVRSASSQDPNEASFVGYENQGFYYKMMPDYEGSNLLNEKQKAALKKKYAGIVKALKEQADGCELITVFGPSPATIYPERVPEKFKKAEGETRLDHVQDIFAEAGATVVDLRPSLLAHKADDLALYCLYDTHWTDYAGYLAYVELYRYIAQRFPEAAPRPFTDFTWKKGYFNNEDTLYYLGLDSWNMKEFLFRRDFACEVPKEIASFRRFTADTSVSYGSYSDAVLSYRTFRTGNEALPKIYVMRNSFSGQMIDIMSERSCEATFREMFDYNFDMQDIAAKKPDYVILVVSEWDIGKLY